MSDIFLVAATFLASVVEMVEMTTIVLGVGATRGWRSTLIGVGTGFIILAAIIILLGSALTGISINWLRLVIGALLLIFGLQWLRRGILHLTTDKRAKNEAPEQEQEFENGPIGVASGAFDWTAFVLALKGVLLEGLEIAFIVVSFGAGAHRIGLAAIGAGAAVVIIGGIGAAAHGLLSRIPRNWLLVTVGVLLTTFGTFWATEGAGVEWPGGDAAILGILALFIAATFGYVMLVRHYAASGRWPTAVAHEKHEKVEEAKSFLFDFAMFWYNFFIGDDWTIAASVVVALGIIYWMARLSILALWWLLPLVVILGLGFTLYRTA